MAHPFRMKAMHAVICLFGALTALAQQPARAQAVEQTLANGLRVIVKEDHRAPTVVSMVWYKAGSVDEFNGTTGVAHVLEHMMFKGTREVPGGEFSRIVAAVGGNLIDVKDTMVARVNIDGAMSAHEMGAGAAIDLKF